MLQPSKIERAARIIKNSAAMLASAALAKGGGLIVTILVARYLGVASLGIFSVLLSLSLLLEIMTPLGQQDVLVRTIARNRSLMFSHWINASMTTLLVALVCGIVLVSLAQIKNLGVDATLALYVVACGLPFAGMNLVAQAVLQGVERMQYQPMAAFIGRLLGLLVLWLLLMAGAGIWAAFAGRALFQLTSLLILSYVVCRHATQHSLPMDWRPRLAACKANLLISVPFSIQRFLTEGLNRLNVLILPILVTVETVGLFNAANQITQTSSAIIPIVMLTLLPAFSRSFKTDREKSRLMADQMLKFLLILIFPFAFVVTIAADKIILLLYGVGYEASIPVLQLVIWSQVFIAADAVMKQNMIASDNERSMVWRSALAVIANLALTITLSKLYGIYGIAAAVVLTSALLLALDTQFVAHNVFKTNFLQAVGKPFVCALLAGIIAFALADLDFVLLLSLTGGAYAIFLAVFKAFTREELFIMRQLLRVGSSRTTAN